ncbi:MAG: hypothetical protein QXP84_08120 [Candidatus Korarchaeum sp.]
MVDLLEAVDRAFPCVPGRKGRNLRYARNLLLGIAPLLNHPKSDNDVIEALYRAGYTRNAFAWVRPFVRAYFYPRPGIKDAMRIILEEVKARQVISEDELLLKTKLPKPLFFEALFRLIIEGKLRREVTSEDYVKLVCFVRS